MFKIITYDQSKGYEFLSLILKMTFKQGQVQARYATKLDKSLRSIYKRKKTGTVTMLKLEAMVSIFLFCIEI